jgi:CheY-like chemotaxis protein
VEKKGNLLLVEDDLALVRLLEDSFENICDEIFTANNGYEALEVLEKEVIHAILSDFKMPKMDGLTLLKESANKYQVPFIVLTAYGDDEAIQSALDLGAMGVFKKPHDFTDSDVFLEKVQEALQMGLEKIGQ